MARTSTRPRPAQGAHLARLRKQAGLTQVELAALLGVPQSNIAFWERSAKPPRSDVLPKMAEALGVGVADLLSADGGRVTARRYGPVGKVRQVFEEVSRLPRRQQEKIVELVTAIVRQYEQERQ